MTKLSKHFIQCCECDHEQTVELADSLNATIDPDSYDRVVNYKDVMIQCDKCGFKGFYDHPILYHDMERQFMVQYSSNTEDLKEFIKQNEVMQNTYGDITNQYTMRVCDFYPDFVEKVMILTHGYNDIVMEFYKNKLRMELKDKTIRQIYYEYNDEDKDLIAVRHKDNTVDHYYFVKELYDHYLNIFNTLPVSKRNDIYIVNIIYALNINSGNDEPLHYELYNMEKKEEKEEE